jgi:hypothetical protein
MAMKILCRRSLHLWLLVLLLGCLPAKPKISQAEDDAFRKQIGMQELNSRFRISTPKDRRADPRFGSDIEVLIENVSNETIGFPIGFGIRMFALMDSHWLEVENADEYYGESGSLLYPKDRLGMGGQLSTVVRPLLPLQMEDMKEKVVLRIMLLGEAESPNGGTEKTPVGAYTDVYVEP